MKEFHDDRGIVISKWLLLFETCNLVRNHRERDSKNANKHEQEKFHGRSCPAKGVFLSTEVKLPDWKITSYLSNFEED